MENYDPIRVLGEGSFGKGEWFLFRDFAPFLFFLPTSHRLTSVIALVCSVYLMRNKRERGAGAMVCVKVIKLKVSSVVMACMHSNTSLNP